MNFEFLGHRWSRAKLCCGFFHELQAPSSGSRGFPRSSSHAAARARSRLAAVPRRRAHGGICRPSYSQGAFSLITELLRHFGDRARRSRSPSSTASSLNSGEKLFFDRGNYFTFPRRPSYWMDCPETWGTPGRDVRTPASRVRMARRLRRRTGLSRLHRGLVQHPALHSSLGYLSPAEYESIHHNAARQAA